MENFSPTHKFSEFVILEYPGGGAELALPLPEDARAVCIAAARIFRTGNKRTAKDIFIRILEMSVPDRLKRRLRNYSVTELAELAAFLLNCKWNQTVQQTTLPEEAVRRAILRVTGK